MLVVNIGKARPKVQMRECVTFKCAHCGSKRVTKDSDSEWDEVAQRWVTKRTFETAECEDCGTETRLATEVIS